MYTTSFIALFAAVAGLASAAPSSSGSPGGSDSGITPTQYRGSMKMSADEIAATMKEHNRYRNGCGQTLLKWDDNLAASAQNWADQMGSSLQHSETGSDRPGYGENLAWSSNGDAGSMTKQWTDECSICSSQCSFSHDVGHYTQIVWGTTTHVGCGRNSENGYVCHYYPAGNMQGDESAQVCPNGLDQSKLDQPFTDDYMSPGSSPAPTGGNKGSSPVPSKQGAAPAAPQGYQNASPAPAAPVKKAPVVVYTVQKGQDNQDNSQSPQQPRPPMQRPQRRPQRQQPTKPEEDCDEDDKSAQQPNKPVYVAKETSPIDQNKGSYGDDNKSSPVDQNNSYGDDKSSSPVGGNNGSYGSKGASPVEDDCEEDKKR